MNSSLVKTYASLFTHSITVRRLSTNQESARMYAVTPPLSDEQKQQVYDMYNEGLSASMIAAHFPGKTRNAIIGLISRGRELGKILRLPNAMPVRAQRTYNAPKHLKQERAAPPKPVVLAPEEPEIVGPIEDYPPDGCCQYTHDDVHKSGWRMCGQAAPKGCKGFCEYHYYSVVRNPVQPSLTRKQTKHDGRQFNGTRTPAFRPAIEDRTTDAHGSSLRDVHLS